MEEYVSIIVPVYKVEKYLDRCVESIVSQKYKNIEIILIDDGSPDRCPDMCDGWKEKDERIKVIHKQNGGLSEARNAGLQIAEGEYIVFVDSDDYIEPTMISNLVSAIKKNGSKMALSGIRCINESGERVYEKDDSPIRDGNFTARELLPLFYENLGWYYIVAWNKMYHRSLFENKGFPVGKIHEDEFVAAQLIWEAGNIECISNEEYNYIYMRKGAITSSNRGIKFVHWLEALYIRYNFYKSKNAKELMMVTRAVYFRELEKLFLDEEMKGSLSKPILKQVKGQYEQMKEKTMREKIYWILFQISPRIEYSLVRKLRVLKGNNK